MLKAIVSLAQIAFCFAVWWPYQILADGPLPDAVPIEQLDAERLEKEPSQPELPVDEALPEIPAGTEDESNSSSQQSPPSVPEPSAASLLLKRVSVQGSKSIDPQVLQSVYQPYLQKKVTLLDLHQIRDSITALYRRSGMVLSRAFLPPQDIQHGHVNFLVIEGYVGRSHVEGTELPVKHLLEKIAHRATQMRPFNIKTLERLILLANDLPGISVKAILRKTETRGMAELVFLVKSVDRVDGFMGIDNRISKLLGSTQLNMAFYINQLVPNGQTGIHTQISNQLNQLQAVTLQHRQWLGPSGWRFSAQMDWAKTRPNLTSLGAGELNLRGRQQGLTLGVDYPLLRSRQHNLSLSSSVRLTNSRTTESSAILFEDKIRSLRVGIKYDTLDRFRGVNLFHAEWSQGLNVLGATKTGSPRLSRSSGRSDYTKFTLEWTRLQRVTSSWTWYNSMRMQHTPHELLSSQEIGFGGQSYGRGYENSEINGDYGVIGRSEWRYDQQLARIQSIRCYAFTDAGIVWNHDADQRRRQTALSVGLGTHIQFNAHSRANFEIAKPINRAVSIRGNRHPRIFFGLTFSA